VRVADGGEVDYQAVVADAKAAGVVAAAADGDDQVIFVRVLDAGDHIGDVGDAGDELRPAVDHAVVDFSGVVVTGRGRFDHLSA